MGLQDAWIKQVITLAKMNNMTLTGGTGAYLAGLSNVAKGTPVLAYDTSNGFIQWHIWVWDGISSWVDTSLPVHKHSSSTDGGPLLDIRQINNHLYEVIELTPNVATWTTANAGTSSAINMHDDTANLARRYQTGISSTGYATGTKGGVNIDFDWPIAFNWVWNLSATNNLYFNLGIAMEHINVAQDNSPKIGIEWCDGQPAANYFVTTASGSARSSSDSTVTITNTMDGVRMLFNPSNQANFKFDTGTSINKSTNLPSGNSSGNNVLREGIKNNNGGSSNRDLRIRGLEVIAVIDASASQWVLP